MTGRRSHAIVLNAVLGAVSAFFLCIPTMYAYFGEMRMSYGRVPELAVTPPAKIAFRLFDRYNENGVLADRIGANLGCHVEAIGVTIFPRCAYAVPPGGTLTGPPRLKIPSGEYMARYDFAGDASCARGEVRLLVRTVGPFRRTLADRVIAVEPRQHTEIPFELDVMDAALHDVQFRVLGISGCVVLRHWDWGDR